MYPGLKHENLRRKAPEGRVIPIATHPLLSNNDVKHITHGFLIAKQECTN